MAQSDDPVEEVDFPLELGAYSAVLVIIRRIVALERALAEEQVAILAEGHEGGNQFRVVEFIEGGENFAVLLFRVGEEREDLGPEEAAESVPQRIARFRHEFFDLAPLGRGV